jgi:hypothetical protein
MSHAGHDAGAVPGGSWNFAAWEVEHWADLFDIVNAIGTLFIGLFAYVFSSVARAKNAREKEAAELAARRASIKEACDGVHMEFALSFLEDQAYEHATRTKTEFVHTPHQHGQAMTAPTTRQTADYSELQEDDWLRVFDNHKSRLTWHKQARQQFIVFLETLRPCAHLFGGPLGAFGLTNPKVDPVSFRLRLALNAFAFYWDPKTTATHELAPEEEERRRRCCPDAVKAWVKNAYCAGAPSSALTFVIVARSRSQSVSLSDPKL